MTAQKKRQMEHAKGMVSRANAKKAEFLGRMEKKYGPNSFVVGVLRNQLGIATA